MASSLPAHSWQKVGIRLISVDASVTDARRCCAGERARGWSSSRCRQYISAAKKGTAYEMYRHDLRMVRPGELSMELRGLSPGRFVEVDTYVFLLDDCPDRLAAAKQHNTTCNPDSSWPHASMEGGYGVGRSAYS